MAGHGGGAWKVAYADFVTAMMAFFLVMWITSQSEEVKKAIGGYFQDPWGTSQESSSPTMQTPAGLTGSVPFADSATGILPDRWPQANQENATEKQPGAASVWQQKQKVFLMTSSDRNLPALVVNFDDSSAELSQAAQQRLKDLLPALIGKQNKIELRAHSTHRPLPKQSSFHDHWQLCYARMRRGNEVFDRARRRARSYPLEPVSGIRTPYHTIGILLAGRKRLRRGLLAYRNLEQISWNHTGQRTSG